MIIYLKFIAKIVKDVKKKRIKSGCKFIGLKSNKLHSKCKECKKAQLERINGLVKTFPNIYRFRKGNRSKFILLLRKDVYRSEYIDIWERFHDTALPNKKNFFQ